MLLYSFIGVKMFDSFEFVQILMRSLKRGGFHQLKTQDGSSLSGMSRTLLGSFSACQ